MSGVFVAGRVVRPPWGGLANWLEAFPRPSVDRALSRRWRRRQLDNVAMRRFEMADSHCRQVQRAWYQP
jgi:hypothetical protein